MIRLRDVELPQVVQSPMANCTDLAFRLIARSCGMRFAFLEMVAAETLVRHNAETIARMRTTTDDQPCGAQLMGCRPEVMAEAARRVEAMGFTVVDINLGCPVPKVTGHGGGSQLLREPSTVERIFRAVVHAVTRIPVTVKVRLGYSDATGGEAVTIARIAEACGLSAVAVHGRTREQGYTGRADYEAIGRVKAAVSIPVFGNGDVTDAASALRLRRISGCDGIMVGRGALGNPWLYRHIEAALSSETPPPAPTPRERKQLLLRHVELMERFEERPVGPLRRVISWYFRETAGVNEFRAAINQAQTVLEMRELIHAFIPTSQEPAAAACCISPRALPDGIA